MDSRGHGIPLSPDETERSQHLPTLREPPGWRELPTPELEERVMTLLQAASHDAHLAQVVDEAVVAPRVEDKVIKSAPVSTNSAHWLVGLSGLPWLVFLAGVIMVVPVLIWAPLIGGLCVGALILQSGLMRQWVRRQTDVRFEFDSSDEAVHRQRAGSLKRIEPIPTREGIRHSGWLLAGVLFLLAVQAAMLIVVLQLKARETTSAWVTKSNVNSSSARNDDQDDRPLVNIPAKTPEDVDQRK